MGCAGGIVALRDALATLRGRKHSLVALLSVELSSLHGQKTLDLGVLTAFALFGDAAAAVLLSSDPASRGPEVVDTYCASDFGAMDQMSWTIGDEGFVMGLSIRVPVTLRRNIGPAVERLLAPHGLTAADVTHWLVHPGGPSILDAIRHSLALSKEQMALSWEILHDHGNCSSTTVLLMLDRLLRSGRTRRGEWGVMMAFGPGLTLETCLLRF
jgi:predicted naringenin-chalcone synthase